MPRRPGLDPTESFEPRSDSLALDDLTMETILRNLSAGNYLATACRAAGISHRTICTWRKAYREGQQMAPEHKKFIEGIDKAIAHGEIKHLSSIEKAARSGQWQASAWLLERRFPKHWARKDMIQVSGSKDGDLKELSDEDLKKLHRRASR